jgi:hypothetical protein
MIFDNPPQVQQSLIQMQPNPEVASKLTARTLEYLRTAGLPASKELGFAFTGEMLLVPTELVRFVDKVVGGLDLCLDLQQNELLRWEGEPESFVNSSVEQFTQCVQAFEYYLEHIQAKEIFGPYYDNTGSKKNRPSYASALADRLRAIDPTVFERGYYWPAFIEEIENGL